MKYYYNADNNYIYQADEPNDPQDKELVDQAAEKYLARSSEVQPSKEGYPLLAGPYPSPFYVWSREQEKYIVTEESKAAGGSYYYENVRNDVLNLSQNLFFNSDWANYTSIDIFAQQELYQQAKELLKADRNGEDVSDNLDCLLLTDHATAFNIEPVAYAKKLIKEYNQLVQTSLALKWFEVKAVTEAKAFNEYQALADYAEQVKNLTVSDVYNKYLTATKRV